MLLLLLLLHLSVSAIAMAIYKTKPFNQSSSCVGGIVLLHIVIKAHSLTVSMDSVYNKIMVSLFTTFNKPFLFYFYHRTIFLPLSTSETKSAAVDNNKFASALRVALSRPSWMAISTHKLQTSFTAFSVAAAVTTPAASDTLAAISVAGWPLIRRIKRDMYHL